MLEKLFGKKSKKGEIVTIQNGKIVPIEEVPDYVFSQKILGDGVAIIPESGEIYSPVNGTIVSTISSGHAYGIQADEGGEILVHIGIDTVALNGDGFRCKVTQNQRVHVGDLLAEVDLELLKSRGYHTIIVVLLTNGNELKNVKKMTGDGKAGKTVIITYEK